jgi:outer membrane protein assembly factor BamB
MLRGSVFVGLVVALVCGVVVGPSAVSGASSGSDWYTYGFTLRRSGENPVESTIGVANASSLHQLWSRSLGGVMVGQPMVAAGVVINGVAHTVVYAGDEHGHFAAIDDTTGTVLWEHTLRTVTITGCTDVAGGVFGIGGGALIDRPGNTVFIAAGDGSVHAFDLATGVEQSGWPVHVFNPKHLTSYGGITTDSGFNSLYVQMASHCDFRPYHGGLAKIDVGTASVTAVFHPAGRFDGGGIWGPGGASYDPASHHVFVATGNAFAASESYGYSEHVVELDGNLKVVGANYPGLTGGDVDFGATPIIYQASGCPVQVAAENKSGVVVVYRQGHLSAGPTQRLQIASVNAEGFVGIPAYSAALRMLFVANSTDSPDYTRGLVAFKVGANCKLSKVWNQTIGPQTPSSPPTVANGVVYYGDGVGGTEYAFNASTGAMLWNSGTQINGSLYAAPTVINGRLLIASWNGNLYAFGP